MLPLRTLLHPTDFSEQSEYAFRVACALARDYHTRLVVVHVLTIPAVVFVEGYVPFDSELIRADAQARLERLEAIPTAQFERHLKEGDPATEILHLQQGLRADLIVMGTHGRTGFARLLLGSVAEEVLRRATCPVLTVRTPVAEVATAEPQLALAAD